MVTNEVIVRWIQTLYKYAQTCKVDGQCVRVKI